jgi:hypothetical protein
LGDQRGHQHDGEDDEEREDRIDLTNHGITSIVRLVPKSPIKWGNWVYKCTPYKWMKGQDMVTVAMLR